MILEVIEVGKLFQAWYLVAPDAEETVRAVDNATLQSSKQAANAWAVDKVFNWLGGETGESVDQEKLHPVLPGCVLGAIKASRELVTFWLN